MSKKMAVSEVLGARTNDKTVRAEAILEILGAAQSTDEKVELLSLALVERDSVPKNTKDLKNAGLTENQWDDFNKSHGTMVSGHLKLAFFKTTSAPEFAGEILRLVDFVQSPQEKSYVIARALFSPYVPYHELPGTPIQMTSEAFNHKLESEKKRLDLIEYICGLPFDEWTEQASLLLQVISDANNKESQVVLLAAALQNLIKRERAKTIKAMKGE